MCLKNLVFQIEKLNAVEAELEKWKDDRKNLESTIEKLKEDRDKVIICIYIEFISLSNNHMILTFTKC